MTLHPKVAEVIDLLLDGIREPLKDNLLGVYLRGSLALGDFDPETSDVDLLVVTERPMSKGEFYALEAMHAELATSGNGFAKTLEVSYIDRASLKRFGPGERCHPSIGADWPFSLVEHRANWIFERWTVRERGIAIFGPDPKDLIDPISRDRLRAAALDELLARLRNWAGDDEIPDWLKPRYYQAFEVETICRALYAIAFGDVPTKPHAVRWALDALPEPACTLVKWSRDWRTDRTEDPSTIREVKSFVKWALAYIEKIGPGP